MLQLGSNKRLFGFHYHRNAETRSKGAYYHVYTCLALYNLATAPAAAQPQLEFW